MADDEILRLRAAFTSEDSLAAMRTWAREVGLMPGKIKPGLKQAELSFGSLGKAIQDTGKKIAEVVPALGAFELGAAGAGVAAGVLLRTFGDMSKRMVELKYATKELGMSERDIRAWQEAGENAGISAQTMTSSLKGLKDTLDGLRFNPEVRNQLFNWIGPELQKLQALDPAARLKRIFELKDTLLTLPEGRYRAEQLFATLHMAPELLRLSYEEAMKAKEKLQIFTPEDMAEWGEYLKAINALSSAWEHFSVKAGALLLPYLKNDIKNIEYLLEKLEEARAYFKENQPEVTPGTESNIIDTPNFQMGFDKNAPVPKALRKFFGPLWGHRQPQAPDQGPPATSEEQNQQIIEDLKKQSGATYAPMAFHPGGEAPLHSGGGFTVLGGGQAGGGLSEGSRMVKEGVFAALVDFQGYLAAGGGATPASLGLPGTDGSARDGSGAAAPTRASWRSGSPGGGKGHRGFGGRDVGGDHWGEGSGAASGNLASQREKFKQELEADPQLKRFAIDAMQHEGGIQSNFEQLMNMAAMRHQTLRQALHSGQYGPVNTGQIRGNISEKTAAAGEAALQKVYGGSNITDYSTDQGMAGDPNYAKYMSNPAYWGMHKVQGAWFSAHGEQGRRWAAQMRAADAARKEAAADPDKLKAMQPVLPDPFNYRRIDDRIAGTTNVKGAVHVSIQHNGTKAKADAKTDGGLWQKTTIDNYKQMQSTNSPVGKVGAFE